MSRRDGWISNENERKRAARVPSLSTGVRVGRKPEQVTAAAEEERAAVEEEEEDLEVEGLGSGRQRRRRRHPSIGL